MRFLTSIIVSLLISAVALSFLSKAEYDNRIEAGKADGLVLQRRSETGPATCVALADSVHLIRTKTVTAIAVAVAALDLKKAYSKGCMTYDVADKGMKELRQEFNSRYETEEAKYKASNMVLAAIRFYKKPFSQPEVEMPDRADESGLFDLALAGEGGKGKS